MHDSDPGVTARAFSTLAVTSAAGSHASSYEALADGLSSIRRDASVLDIGCGDATLLAMLAAREPALSLRGVDISPGELKAARQRLAGLGVVARARAQALPYPSECFDAVVSHMAFMLMPDIDRVLGEARRVLRPDGVLVLVIGAPTPPAAALDLYANALGLFSRQSCWRDVRFGATSWQDAPGIERLMSPAFQDIAVLDLAACKTLAPEAAWLWLADMYDSYLRNPRDRERAREHFLSAAAHHVDAAGELMIPIRLRRVVARLP